MAQLFGRQSNWLARTLFFGLPVLLLVVISVAVAFDRSDYITDQNHFLNQPVPFSHKHHAGQMQISCLYCHNQAEKSRFAQIPATQVCAGCHQKIWPESPMLKPVLESAATGTPVLWQKVTRIPEFVYFDHRVHIEKLDQAQNAAQTIEPVQISNPVVAAGPTSIRDKRSPEDFQTTLTAPTEKPPTEMQTRNTCTLCHGAVETMPLTALAHPMTMAFCLNCHRDPPRYLHDQSVQVLNINGLQSKMDCVTCHR